MKRLIVDMDNCITNALFLERINEFLGTDFKLDDQTEYNLQNLTGDRLNEFWTFMKNKSFYDNAPLIEGAYDALKKLNDKYDLYIASSYLFLDSNPDLTGKHLKNKYEYLKKQLPFISPEKYIFINNKNIIESDIAIDDKLTNLGNSDKKILFNAWHNKDISEKELNEKGIVRVYTWQEILSMLDY